MNDAFDAREKGSHGCAKRLSRMILNDTAAVSSLAGKRALP